MPMIHRRADNHDAASATAALLDDDGKKGMGAGKIYRIAGFLCFLGLFLVLISHNGTSSNLKTPGMVVVDKTRPSPMANYPDLEKAFAKYENCVVNWVPPPPKSEWTTKPLWMPAFPGSGTTGPAKNGDIMKPLINGITGLKGGGKFFHAQSKILKRCKGVDETATCAQGHPVVDVNPQRQAENFHHSVLLVIRNYKSTFPVHINDKAEAYHGATEMVDENEWRKQRDQWYKEVFEGWKSVVTAWRGMPEYDIGAIVQYEELMDPERGPGAVQRIANLLQSAGFTVAPSEDLPCIWFKIVKEEYLRLKTYNKYTAGYTDSQKDYLLKSLEDFQKEVADDPKLVAILKEYYEDIRDNTYIDIPYQER